MMVRDDVGHGRQRLNHAHDLTGRQHADIGVPFDEGGLGHDGRVGGHDHLRPGQLVALLHGASFAQQGAEGGARLLAEAVGAAQRTWQRPQPGL